MTMTSSTTPARNWGRATWRRAARTVATVVLGLVVTQVHAQAAAAATVDDWLDDAPVGIPGWQTDFVDNFEHLDHQVWGRYDGGVPAGTVSTYRAGNVWVDDSIQVGDGVLRLTTRKADGAWTGAGVSSAPGFSAVRGKWVVKAKFDRAYGIGYAFLLMPKGGGWPPEIDIIEGTMGGPHLMSTYHYGTARNHLQVQRWLRGVDMTDWHTYGAVVSDGSIEYTLDGRVWASVSTGATPSMPMWLGFQTGVKDCARSTGECLSSATPTTADISVDWAAHYSRA